MERYSCEKKRCSSSTVSTVPAASSRPASSPATSSGSSGTRPWARRAAPSHWKKPATRSEEHTSELQSLMRTSYAVFCLKKTNKPNHQEPLGSKQNTQDKPRTHKSPH